MRAFILHNLVVKTPLWVISNWPQLTKAGLHAWTTYTFNVDRFISAISIMDLWYLLAKCTLKYNFEATADN